MATRQQILEMMWRVDSVGRSCAIITEASVKNLRNSKNYRDVSEDAFYAVINADPTLNGDNGTYIGWLLKQYIKGDLDMQRLDNVKSALSKFHKLRNAHAIENGNIDSFKTPEELFNAIGRYGDEDTVSNRQKTKEAKLNGATKVYEDSDWVVIVPHTKEAAIEYGKNTKWCTAAVESENHFDFYKEEGKTLYININKKTVDKYQFTFKDGETELKDAENEEIKRPVPETIGMSEGLVNFYKEEIGFPLVGNLWFDEIGDFHDELVVVYVSGKGNSFINKNGDLIKDGQMWFDRAWPFREGMSNVKVNGKWTFINKNGDLIKNGQLWFDRTWPFREGMARVKVDGKYTFINKNGDPMTKNGKTLWFDEAYSFYAGIGLVRRNGRQFKIDKEGNEVKY